MSKRENSGQRGYVLFKAAWLIRWNADDTGQGGRCSDRAHYTHQWQEVGVEGKLWMIKLRL